MPLPPELRDYVIDLLQDDKAAIQACSRISRAWLPRGRYHIFRRVQIQPGPRGSAFKSLLNENPDIGRYVQDVEISGSSQDVLERRTRIEWPTLRPPAAERAVAHSSADWLEDILPSPTKVLRRVSCLRLSVLHVDRELVDVLQRYFSTVKTMMLNKCRSATFGDLCELLRALVHLEHIHILEAHWVRPTSPTPAVGLPRLARPKTLVLSERTDAAVILNWLVSQRLYTSLSSVSCHISGHATAVALRDLLAASGSSLRHLCIGFAEVKDPTVTLRTTELNLRPCTGLHSLHIDCINSQRFSSVPSLSWIIILLSKVNSNTLSDLTFSIAAADIPALNLEGLAVILAHSRHPTLRQLTFNVQVRGESIADVEGRIRTRLSALTTKGVNVNVEYNQRCPSFV